jgi:hypothetical protein
MISKIKALLVGSLFLVGCALTSQNIVNKGTFVLSGGNIGNNRWSDELIFTKTSWYKQTTLVYETLLASLNNKSPFLNWLSAEERKIFASCEYPYLLLEYSLNRDLLPFKIINDQLKKEGFKKVLIKTFELELKNHPQYKISNLMYYKVRGYCSSTAQEGIKFQLPGFKLK